MLLWPHKSFTLPAQPSLMRIGLVVKIVGDPSLDIVLILEHIKTENSWSAKKQPTVSCSSAEAKYRAL